VLIICRWALRNQRVAGIFTFSDEGVWNLYWFTAPAVLALAEGRPIEAVREALDREATRLSPVTSKSHQTLEVGSPALAPAVWHFMVSRSLSVVTQHPVETAYMTLDGFGRLAFAPYELQTPWQGFIANHRTFRMIKFVSTTVQALTLGLLWIGVLLALIRSQGDGRRWILLCSALLLILAASPYADGINMRYRSPALPFLAVLAAFGWSDMWRHRASTP
jgi:hypothetical protein